MKPQVPQIFDPERRRMLQKRIAAGAHMFLYDYAAAELCDRATSVNRQFSQALIFAPKLLHDFFRRQLETQCQALSCVDTADDSFDPELWDFTAECFDLVIILGALHCVNDLPGSLVQLRARLKPDGIFLTALAGGEGLSTIQQCFIAAESEITGRVAAHFHPALLLPDLAALMQRAGFALPVVDLESVVARYSNLMAVLHDIKAMGESNCLYQRDQRPLRRDVIARAEELARAAQPKDSERLTIQFDILFATGWAPHESQPKALRPGSAQHRLADVLGTTEISLPDAD